MLRAGIRLDGWFSSSSSTADADEDEFGGRKGERERR